MSLLSISNVFIRGIAAAVPKQRDCIKEVYKWGSVEDFLKTTGIVFRRRAPETVTASDLCVSAARNLLNELHWNNEDIDILVFVSQTPDYLLPATSCVIHENLNLSKECYTLDISLGCSGWVYALSVIAALMQNGTFKKGLLLAGDTITKICSPDDKTVYPLFGDAGSATALEFDVGDSMFKFHFNSDGSGNETIIARGGGFREKQYTIPRLELDGGEVFSFGAFKAPKQVKALIEEFQLDIDKIDLFTFHQANFMMNEMIRKKLKLPDDMVPYSMGEFGNTSCASIPLTLTYCERNRLRKSKLQHIACGFGVGLSWASVWFETDKITVPKLIEV